MRVKAKISYIDESGTRKRGDEFDVTKKAGEALRDAGKVTILPDAKPANG